MWLWNRWLGRCTKTKTDKNKTHTPAMHTHTDTHILEARGSIHAYIHIKLKHMYRSSLVHIPTLICSEILFDHYRT